MTDQRWKHVKAHIAAGDKAKDKSEQHYISAGQYLIALKAEHTGTWAEWEALLKERVGIGKSRASEVMQIAAGTKTVKQIRDATTKKVRRIRARKSSPVRTGETALVWEDREKNGPVAKTSGGRYVLNNAGSCVRDGRYVDRYHVDFTSDKGAWQVIKHEVAGLEKAKAVAERDHKKRSKNEENATTAVTAVTAETENVTAVDAPSSRAETNAVERSKVLAADARWAVQMVESNPKAARWLCDLIRDDERRTAFVNALVQASGDAATGNDTDTAASAKRMSQAHENLAEEDDADEKPRRRGKAKEVETKLGEAVHEAFLDLAALGEDCQEVVDNSEAFSQTQRIQTLEATAGELAGLAEPTVPAELAELPVKYLPGRVTSRATRCWAATEILQACADALASIPEGDERHAAASTLSSELDDAIDVRDNCEFPGMYG
jgi:hypothetical protein